MSGPSSAGLRTAAPELCVGIDLGTSGVRAVATTAGGQLVAQAKVGLPAPLRFGVHLRQQAGLWWQAVQEVLDALLAQVDPQAVGALAVDGTSGTLLLCDGDGRPLAPASMYNDTASADSIARIAAWAPPESAAHGSSSPLARLLDLQQAHGDAAFVLHQADWIAAQLSGILGLSDDNNALKLGWDPVQRVWPDWMKVLDMPLAGLPEVRPPGSVIGPLLPALAQRWGLRRDLQVVAGTTDGVAAFLATGAADYGDAVTSLGSTLVLKLLSDRPVSAPDYGVYSHRLADGPDGRQRWLVGGASNTGGAALLRHFSAEQMAVLTPLLQAELPTGLDYYPLPGRGERFPVNDPHLLSRDTPRPADDAMFFQGLLEGIAAVEALAYRRIAELGARPLTSVRSVGGGAGNAAWTAIRRRALGVAMAAPAQDEAACGAAVLAWAGWTEQRRTGRPGHGQAQ